MPLRAMLKGQSTFAYNYDEPAWQLLKETYRADGLVTHCCQRVAIPKTSKLGLFFFAHASRTGCTSKPESPEHLYLKTVIAKAATSAGWEVFTESPGTTPDGERWEADVYCVKDKARIALEVQLSYQSAPELLNRQRIYARSSVRAAWFVASSKIKAGYLRASKEVPFFTIEPVMVGKEPVVCEFGALLSHFVIALLGGKITWKVETNKEVFQVHYLLDTCWRCGRDVKQVYGSGFEVYFERAKTVPNMSTVLKDLGEQVSNDQLRRLGLNSIGAHPALRGNAPGFPFCNECIHCGSPQNNHYVMKTLSEQIDGGERLGAADVESFVTGPGRWHYEK